MSIIEKYKPIGKGAHDARPVAIMQVQHSSYLYHEPRIFSRYADIITILNESNAMEKSTKIQKESDLKYLNKEDPIKFKSVESSSRIQDAFIE